MRFSASHDDSRPPLKNSRSSSLCSSLDVIYNSREGFENAGTSTDSEYDSGADYGLRRAARDLGKGTESIHRTAAVPSSGSSSDASTCSIHSERAETSGENLRKSLRRPAPLNRGISVLSRQSLANVRLEDTEAKRNSTTPTVWLIIATAAMTYTLHGFGNSVTNGVIVNTTFLRQFPQIDTAHTSGPTKNHNSTMQGVTVGLYQVGCAAGAFACYFLSDRIGRKRVIHILGLLNCIGIILQVTAYTLPHLIIGRVVMGLGVGAGHATFPLYLAECVTSRIRGRAIIACAAAGNFGHFLGAVMEIAFYFVHSSAQWRTPIALELVWGLSSAVLPFWCPESPRFLIRKGRYEHCIESLSKLSGLSDEDPEVLEEIQVLEEALHEAGANEVQSDRRKSPRKYYRASLAVFIQIMSSMSGIDVVSFFSTQTFEVQLHFSALVSRYLTMGLQACQWLFSTISILLIDSMGRRPLLLYCAGLMSVAMACLYGLSLPSASEAMLKASILFYFLTMCAYPVGYHLIPAMYTAEISPGAIRHEICSFAGCIHFLFDFLVTLITPIAFTSIGSRYYLVYTATNAFTFAILYLLFLETKGIELETIDEIFDKAPGYFSFVKYGKKRAALSEAVKMKQFEAAREA